MIKELLRSLDYAIFGEVALVMFFIIFVVVVWRAWRSDRQQMQHYAQLVLDETPRKELPNEQ